MIVFSLLISIGITYKFSTTVDFITEYVETELPNFYYENGELHVEQEELIEINKEEIFFGTIMINTVSNQAELAEQVENFKKYSSGIFLNKEQVGIKLNDMAGTVFYNYKDIEIPGEEKLTKQEIISYIKDTNKTVFYIGYYIVTVIYLFLIYTIIIFMDAIMISLIGYIISRIARINLRYTPILNIAINSLTLSILLNAGYILLNTITGFEIKYFTIMYNGVAFVYLTTAILMIKSEMVKQQMELLKLEEEQKKVREELQRQEEEQREKEELKRREQEKEKKRKEKEQKENKNKEAEPEGSGA